MIRYLKQEESWRCHTLWAEAFPEDSIEFKDYYFTEKTKENRILVLEEDGVIVAMLHQNPYHIQVGKLLWPSEYLVGVATKADKRQRGYMRQLLNYMMQDMWDKQMPFSFLMPADAAIYRPFGYAYIYDQPQWELTKDLREEPLGSGKMTEDDLADWINQWLKMRYEVFTKRNQDYLSTLQKELASEAGELTLLYDENRMVGVKGMWGLETPTQRLLMCEPEYRKEHKAPKPAIMARIICVQEFVKAIRLREHVAQEEIKIVLILEDLLLPQNQGKFIWHVNHKSSWLEPSVGDTEGIQTLQISVDRLTQWLFGYKVPEEAEPFVSTIRSLCGVFLDEVV